MQNYQLFWNNSIAAKGSNQLLIDWDTFIRNFTEGVQQHASYRLNQTQQHYIKTLIDPRQTNQIYKNAFLLFCQQYWDIPSNRNRLFKMKINLNLLPRLALMTGSSPQKILISTRFKTQQGAYLTTKYELKQDRLYQLDQEGFEVGGKDVNEKGFLAIGADSYNDIQPSECIYVNGSHLKLISVKHEIPGKKSIYSQKTPEPQIQTEWFIRDSAKSNRVKYLLDVPYKYVIVKPGMVLTVGLTDEIELAIQKIGYNSGQLYFSTGDYDQMSTLLNADRINFMGQIDQKIPFKTILDIDYRQISAKEIEDLFNEGQYYPQFKEESTKKEKEAPLLTFSILNKRTFEKRQLIAGETTFNIGRDKNCNYRIQGVSIRKKQLIFQYINNFWTVRSAQSHKTTSLQINVPSVYLPSSDSIQSQRNSTRIRLTEGRPYFLRAKNFQIDVELKQPQKQED